MATEPFGTVRQLLMLDFRMRSLGVGKKIFFSFSCVLLAFLVLECAVSCLYRMGLVGQKPSIWIYEDSGKTIQFDPVRGYRLTQTPSRFARISHGAVEYSGLVRGNNEGFADRDDFVSERTDTESLRIAVFGDSFSTGWELQPNWPDQVEDLAIADGQSWQLLNFSIDGGGLRNWWSIIARHVRVEDYQLDGILFAVYSTADSGPDDLDLNRGFSICEHRGFRQHMWASLESWDPEDWPRTEADALPYLGRMTDAYILPPVTYAEALAGNWRPEVARPRPWRPYLSTTLRDVVYRLVEHASQAKTGKEPLPEDRHVRRSRQLFAAGQMKLIDDIAAFAQTSRLPVLVVSVPSKQGLIRDVAPRIETIKFASILRAEFRDGNQAFAGLSEREIRDHWHPYDGHWSQKGSDRFARFMLQAVRTWDRRIPPADSFPDDGGD